MHPDFLLPCRARHFALLSSTLLVLSSCSDGPAPACGSRGDAGSRSVAPCVDEAAAPPPEAAPTSLPFDAAADAPSDRVGTDAAADAPAVRVETDATPDVAGDTGAPDAGVQCDLSRDPNDEPCLVDDAYGVFVATSGQQGARGSRTDPMPTIAQAMALAAATGRARVYVCQGQYEEELLLNASLDGISLYGGFACVDHWRAGGTPSLVKSPKPFYALHVDSLTQPITIEDFVFASADATTQDAQGNGGSSITALVHASTVTLRRVSLFAGRGAPGVDGAAGAITPNYTAPIAAAGTAGSFGSAGVGGQNQCNLFGASNGGAGGFAGLGTYPAGSGSAVPPIALSPPLDGMGGETVCPNGQCTTFAGHAGAHGLAGAAAVAAAGYGSLSSAGWVPSGGADGVLGNPGQGGGGGGGQAYPISPCQLSCYQFLGGAGGGAGGCGGSPGKAGGGGGASIALVSLNAQVLLAQGKIQTSAAGAGGAGGTGQGGQPGGPSALPSAPGYLGGPGGNGAGGGGGSGGAGGISAGVAYQGLQPTVDNTSILLGAAGSAGSGGAGGTRGGTGLDSGHPGANGAPGHPGVSIEVLAL